MPTLQHPPHRALFPLMVLSIGLSACGGGGGSNTSAQLQPKLQAAALTAQSASLCSAISPFYWEIGSADGPMARGQVGDSIGADTPIPVASGSKWMYAAYVVQLRGAEPVDRPYLQFTSGYSNMIPTTCEANPSGGDPTQTVDQCLASRGAATVSGGNQQGSKDANTEGKFYYNSGHMTVHASDEMGLGAQTTAGLTAQIGPVLAQGSPLGAFGYARTDLASGVITSANGYAVFLRNILRGRLSILSVLGQDAVCTNPANCPSALYSPVNGLPAEPVSGESWHYGRGHWVEDDPTPQPDGTTLGDGAFSSPGALGFYPWIDDSKTYYGIVARVSLNSGASFESVECGRMIRKAFLTGEPQLAEPVTPAV